MVKRGLCRLYYRPRLHAHECSCTVIARHLAANAANQDGDLLFAIGHAAEMLEALQVAYIAAYEERKPIDR